MGREAPKVDDKTALILWTKAGGRCSFPGCPEYLLRDNLSMDDIKHGHIAHIIAASKNGPRGDEPLSFTDRSKIENLILVCQKHHEVIDDPKLVEKYPKELLLEFKKQHEELIYELTGCTPDRATKVVRMQARIAGQQVSASYHQICQALFLRGRFPREATFVDIDLTQQSLGETEAFVEYGTELICSQIEPIYNKHVISGEVEHISVFAIGPIPLLIYLGSKLSSKVPTDVYQRHRDTEDWSWKEEAGMIDYRTDLIHGGSNPANVALIMSLSGKIAFNQLPEFVDESFYIYEMTLDGVLPNPQFLRTLEDHYQFITKYHSFISEVRAYHPKAETLHFFPAIPASIAVACGRELLPKVNPRLSVYDQDKARGGFNFMLEV